MGHPLSFAHSLGRSNTPGGVRFGVMGLTCESDLDSSQGPTRSPEMYGTQFTTSYDRTRAHNSVRRFHGPRRSYIAVGEQRGAQKHAPMRAAPLLNGPAAPHGRPSQPPTQKHASIGRIRSLRATPGPPDGARACSCERIFPRRHRDGSSSSAAAAVAAVAAMLAAARGVDHRDRLPPASVHMHEYVCARRGALTGRKARMGGRGQAHLRSR